MPGFLLIFRVITEGFGHDNFSLGISFGLKGHFFHFLSKFFFVKFLLILFSIILIHDFPSVSVHNYCISGIVLHLKVLSFLKSKSAELVSHF